MVVELDERENEREIEQSGAEREKNKRERPKIVNIFEVDSDENSSRA